MFASVLKEGDNLQNFRDLYCNGGCCLAGLLLMDLALLELEGG